MISIMKSGGAQLVVRNIEAGVKERLRRRARLHGRSMEEEVRDILRMAAHEAEAASSRLGTRISRRFSKIGIDADIHPLRGGVARPARFSK